MVVGETVRREKALDFAEWTFRPKLAQATAAQLASADRIILLQADLAAHRYHRLRRSILATASAIVTG